MRRAGAPDNFFVFDHGDATTNRAHCALGGPPGGPTHGARMFFKPTLVAATFAGVAFVGPAFAELPEVESVNAICVFSGADPQPFTVTVTVLGNVSGAYRSYTFTNTATGKQLSFNNKLSSLHQPVPFQLPAGHYWLAIRYDQHANERGFGGYSDIVVKPFRVETSGGQKICKELAMPDPSGPQQQGTVKPGAQKGP